MKYCSPLLVLVVILDFMEYVYDLVVGSSLSNYRLSLLELALILTITIVDSNVIKHLIDTLSFK